MTKDLKIGHLIACIVAVILAILGEIFWWIPALINLMAIEINVRRY